MAKLEISAGVQHGSSPNVHAGQKSDSFINLCAIPKECKRVEK